MKILEFRAENIKNLKVVEIRPEDGAVILSGKNGAGKSAVLDAILMCLTGNKIEQPIRNGENRAEIDIDLGDYRIKRIFTAKGERLELMSSEGAVFKTPQALLDKILGRLTFDPLAFASMPQKQQRELLASLVGLDFNELNKRREELYNERTIRNREIKGGDPTSYRKDAGAPLPLESLVGNMVRPAESTPRQEISMAEELAKVEVLEEKLRIHEKWEAECCKLTDQRSACESNIHLAEEEILQLQKNISDLNDRIQLNREGIEYVEEEIELMVEPEIIGEESITVARRGLLEIEEKNKQIRKAVEFDRLLDKLETARREVAKLEEGMAKIDIEKQNRLNQAVFPIKGLGMTDEYVTFQNKPFSQLSTGEQVRISTAVAMALNPTLKIVLIREGSLLDQGGMQEVLKIAKEKSYQLWIERVSDDKGVGIYLENGEVK